MPLAHRSPPSAPWSRSPWSCGLWSCGLWSVVLRSPTFRSLPLALCAVLYAFSLPLTLFSQSPTNAPALIENPAVSPAAPGPSNPAPSANAVSSMETLDDKHRLGIGDRLSFRIVEDQEDPKPLLVTDSGDLEVPYIGRFPAEGKNCKELALAIKAELEKEYYYQATVIIAVDLLSRNKGKVYLVGSIRAPGPQELPGDELFTLSKAIMRAGGFADFADKKKVRVTRKDPLGSTNAHIFTVNVGDVIERGKTEKDLPLEPGDLIYVPSRMLNF